MNLPRFSLRLLLLAVAVLCAWLAWERSVVGRRRIAAEMLRADPDFKVRTVDEVLSRLGPTLQRRVRDLKVASIPALRSWMGDVPIQAIAYYDDEAEPEKVALAKRLFPEALVRPISNPLPRFQRAPLPAP